MNEQWTKENHTTDKKSKSYLNHSYIEIQQLLEEAKEGSRESEGKLIQMLEPLLIRNCRRYFGYIDDDLLQQGRVKMLENIRRFDLSQKNIRFLGYAAKMIGYYYWDEKKKQMKRQSHETATFDPNLLSEQSYEERGFAGIEIQELLQGLSKEQRYLIEQNILRGIPLTKMAKAMGLSLDRTKYLKKKALQKLRESCV